MNGEELKAWRKGEKLSLEKAAERLGVGRSSLPLYESGKLPIPEKIEAQIKGATIKAESSPAEIVEKVAAIRKPSGPLDMGERRAAEHVGEIPHADDPRRFVMEDGLSGIIREADWTWHDLAKVPPGVWRKILKPQRKQANGMVVTAIDYHSNGVGPASMVLRGATLGKGALPSLEGIGAGAYHPANFRDTFDDNLKAGDSKTAAARKALEIVPK